MTTFKEIGIEPHIVRAIDELGFVNPMPIQEKVIPYLNQKECSDIVALAQTGTGKTAAFGLPLIQKTDASKKYTQNLILCPTRELCLQITSDLQDYSKYVNGLKIIAVYGGSSIDKQIHAIKKGVQIIVATPGRLLDLLHRGVINISKISTVVLDEADEMLNMGFRDDLEEILVETPDEKNTLLFSATMPADVQRIAKRYMNNPVEFSVGKRNAGAENVEHICYMVQAKDRYLALKRIADYYPEIYGIIFCRTRKETQEVADKLMQDGYNADSLHGDLSQMQRDTVMNKFRKRNIRLLVATDVAARGLDVDDLTHIINYNLPEDLEIYTHRSGRTGRAGKKGISIVIANLKEKNKLRQIEKQVNKKFQQLPVPLGAEICERQLFHLIDRMENVEVNYSQISAYLPNIYKKLEWLNREDLIKKFVSVEFNRFLEYYKQMPDLNVPEESRSFDKKKSRRSNDGFTRFFINLGKTDNLQPTTLIGMVNDYTGVRDIELGKIEILKNFSFFEVESGFADKIIPSFKNKKMKQRDINVEVAEKKRNSGQHDDNRTQKRRGKFGDKKEKKSFGSKSKKRGSKNKRSFKK